mmetsp:Transcript_57087/g.152309  ORF Transcript_57087/g.152309 Transcript_57087/m.152309 type:complete len:153 (-) Transcript_57087:8-466(-)
MLVQVLIQQLIEQLRSLQAEIVDLSGNRSDTQHRSCPGRALLVSSAWRSTKQPNTTPGTRDNVTMSPLPSISGTVLPYLLHGCDHQHVRGMRSKLLDRTRRKEPVCAQDAMRLYNALWKVCASARLGPIANAMNAEQTRKSELLNDIRSAKT